MKYQVPIPTTDFQESRLKIRWRKHEMIWVSLITVIAIIRCCWNWATLTPKQLESVYLIVYNSNKTPFTNYYTNVWLPQIVSILIFYVSYMIINRLIIPSVKSLFLKEMTGKIIKKICRLAGVLVLLVFLILFGTNLSAYLANPILFGGGFHLSTLFGYTAHPLTYAFDGFSRTISLLIFIFLLGFLREIIVSYFEKPILSRAYWVSFINQFTTFAAIYFSILYLFSALNFEKEHFLFIAYFLVVPSTFLVFMSNIYWLFPWKGETPVFSYRVLLRLFLSTFICTFPFIAYKDPNLPQDQFILFLLCWMGQLLVTTPVSWLVYCRRKDSILRLKSMEKELIETQADLQLLRSQINPHFLFNTLNTLYGIALREKSPDTAKGIQMLGDMMRFMLHENPADLIPMLKEVEYLENYIALQKLRMQISPGISIEVMIEEQYCNHQIAPMLLIPFVENAFKHGINPEASSWIKISLDCNETDIRFEVRNSLHPKTNNDPEKNRSGIGVKNVLERLNIIYPNRHQVNICDDGREFLVRLVIQP
ncbi:histidine kinase [Chitinophaga sp. 212800010-3]|uniref:sensor histidine kinase n=1 Tax=unclassified Chitinophaga TaxID=2619133 RepID=UPI002DF2979C|nr:His-kinase domain-containing protein [Chitinophaga sp. 212800010-3]